MINIAGPYDAQAEPLLRSLGLPSINDMIYQESVSLVYKAVNNQAPIYLTNLFNKYPLYQLDHFSIPNEI